MKIYDRKTKTYEDIVQYGAGKLDFLYNNFVGRIFLGIAVSPFVSNIYAWKNSKKSSAKKTSKGKTATKKTASAKKTTAKKEGKKK